MVKAVKGTVKTSLLTTPIKDELSDHPGSIMLSPAIYHELIAGNRHVRAHCFDDTVVAAVIECSSLDWRPYLDSPTTVYEVPELAKERLRNVLKMLGIRMRVFDIKLTGDDELVWLEVNPQGQFLFIQGICGLDLEEAFCQFLRATLMGRAKLH